MHCMIVFVVLLVIGFDAVNGQRISASPSVIPSTNTPLTITWASVSTPTEGDRINIYSPASLLNDDGLMGFFVVSEIEMDWKTGSGSYAFEIVNVRASISFQYMSANGSTLQPVATSNVIDFASYDEPTQGHLALTANPTEMRVMWVSGRNTSSKVEYGLTMNLGLTATGTAQTYTTDDLCAAPANSPKNGGWREPGWQHDVLLTNLNLNTKYYYRFGSDDTTWSDIHSFVTSPGVGSQYSIDFIMFGDMGVQLPFHLPEYWTNYGLDIQDMAPKSLKWLARYADQNANSPKLVLDIGDISYARGRSTTWDWYMESIAPVAMSSPWMVAIGNHEFDYVGQPWRPSWADYGTDSSGECGVPYSMRFNMPSPTYATEKIRNLWYSFEMGPVHFTFMSAEHDFLMGSDQWNWLVKDFSSVDRTKTPWIIFMGHRPFYSSGLGGSTNGVSIHLRNDIEPLLFKYDVDLVLVGHVHQYERTCGFVKNATCASNDSDGVVHIVVGTAGNTFQVSWDDANAVGHKHQPDWSVFRTTEWGISEMKANATVLEFFYYGNQRGELHDYLVLNK